MLKTLFYSCYYQLLMSLRIKQSVFFTIVFPVFLFIVFGNIWGVSNPEYISFLLSGVIGMTIASEGFFAIAPALKEYYSSGLIKYLRKLPFNILIHFSGLILNRVIILLFVFPFLFVTSYYLFGYQTSFQEITRYIATTFLGLFIFSFIGLVINFSGIKNISDKGINNLLYYVLLFTSDSFYPASELNKVIGRVANLLPLNPILNIMREGTFSYVIIFWLIIPPIIFYFLFNRVKVIR